MPPCSYPASLLFYQYAFSLKREALDGRRVRMKNTIEPMEGMRLMSSHQPLLPMSCIRRTARAMYGTMLARKKIVNRSSEIIAKATDSRQRPRMLYQYSALVAHPVKTA